MEDLGDAANQLNACYGDKDPRAARAEEAQAAVQRLLWALERPTQLTTSGDAAGSARVREMVEVDVKGKRPVRSVPVR